MKIKGSGMHANAPRCRSGFSTGPDRVFPTVTVTVPITGLIPKASTVCIKHPPVCTLWPQRTSRGSLTFIPSHNKLPVDLDLIIIIIIFICIIIIIFIIFIFIIFIIIIIISSPAMTKHQKHNFHIWIMNNKSLPPPP